jgi:copper chaperone CopZ
MSQKTVSIPAISCGHCVATIEREVRDLAGVKLVKADPVKKEAFFEWEAPADWEQIKALLVEIEYPAQELIQL